MLGNRDTATVRRLYKKLCHLKDCIFYTDDWAPFAQVLPSDRHVVGKKYTVTIEQNNSNTRHFSGRFTRRTKVVSKKEDMVDVTLKLIQQIAEGSLFGKYQAQALYIY